MEDFIQIVNYNIKQLNKSDKSYKTNFTKILVLLETSLKISRLKYVNDSFSLNL